MIIAPHFPPSNLAGVHRSRLFAQHLPSLGWEPVILSVEERFYEEKPDYNLVKLLSPDLRIENVKAFGIGKFRIIGDIGLRAFFQLYRKAKKIIQNERVDFLYIPIPSFYTALLGRWLHATTGILYGIDYIDPWVHEFPGSEKLFSRPWFSTRLAKLLEPVAVKKASVITGVGEGYYKGVLERNPHLATQCIFGAMPYGGEIEDHNRLKELSVSPYLFKENQQKITMVYAGTMLPKSYAPFAAVCKSISENRKLFEDVEFHFIGTGEKPGANKPTGIESIALKYNLWQNVVFEYPRRIQYLDVLAHLNIADGIFILGSTEAHYTPSKTYQAILSRKPILAVLHKQSTAVDLLRKSGAGLVLDFQGIAGVVKIEKDFTDQFTEYRIFMSSFDARRVDEEMYQDYSAYKVTEKLSRLLDKLN